MSKSTENFMSLHSCIFWQKEKTLSDGGDTCWHKHTDTIAQKCHPDCPYCDFSDVGLDVCDLGCWTV